MTRIEGWRILPAHRSGRALDPVTGPEGRFHHDGQQAIYLSLTVEGAGVSISRYLGPDDLPRVIAGVRVTGGRLADLADPATHGLALDPADATERWELVRERGAQPAAWALADLLRAQGFDGLLYPSRQRPDLTNLVLFRWGFDTAPTLTLHTPPRPWRP